MAEKFFDPIDAKKDKKKSKTQKQLKKEEFKKEHNRLIAERNRLFNLEKQATKKCEQDIKNKRKDLKRQLVEKKIDKSAYRKEFNNFKFARYEQLQVEIAKIYDKSDKDLPKPFSFKFKRWLFGLGKEFRRVTWSPGKKILVDFGIIIILCAIMALIFLGIDELLHLAKII